MNLLRPGRGVILRRKADDDDRPQMLFRERNSFYFCNLLSELTNNDQRSTNNEQRTTDNDTSYGANPELSTFNLELFYLCAMRIFLIGPPGAGKTYLGKIWAADNGLGFYDLDQLIGEEERMSIESIFSEFGESYFREKEAAVLRNTDRFDHCIIACGGGTPCFFDNMDWMNRNGCTVFLDESPGNIFHHLINDKTQRPLLKGRTGDELKNFLGEISAERMPYYQRSQIRITSENLHRAGFDIILQKIKNA